MHILLEDGEKYIFDGIYYRKFNSKSRNLYFHQLKHNHSICLVKSQRVKCPSLTFELVDVDNIGDLSVLDKNDCKKIVEFFAKNMTKTFDKVMEVSQTMNQLGSPTFSDGIDTTVGKSIVKVLAAQLLRTYLREQGWIVRVDFENYPSRKGQFLKVDLLEGKDIYCGVVNEYELNY